MLQINMIVAFGGYGWWERKKRSLQDARDEIITKEKEVKDKELKKMDRAKVKRVKKKMGLLRYWCCPCLRYKYKDIEAEAAYQAAIDEKKRRHEAILKARREHDLKIKNPVTDPWIRFEKKIEPEMGGSTEFLPRKEVRMERLRAERKDGRAERRQQRLQDPDLNPNATKKKRQIDDDD